MIFYDVEKIKIILVFYYIFNFKIDKTFLTIKIYLQNNDVANIIKIFFKTGVYFCMNKNTDRISRFLTVMDGSFRMKPPQWVLDTSREGQSLVIVDVRERSAFEKSRISGSINIPLKELPDLHEKMITDRQATIVCVCNGSVQSAYAIMFLYTRGYEEVYNLSGGIGRWQKEELPMENT